jgi:hypothetical protein
VGIEFEKQRTSEITGTAVSNGRFPRTYSESFCQPDNDRNQRDRAKERDHDQERDSRS